jgi:hypothetical protein
MPWEQAFVQLLVTAAQIFLWQLEAEERGLGAVEELREP